MPIGDPKDANIIFGTDVAAGVVRRMSNSQAIQFEFSVWICFHSILSITATNAMKNFSHYRVDSINLKDNLERNKESNKCIFDRASWDIHKSIKPLITVLYQGRSRSRGLYPVFCFRIRFPVPFS